MGDGERRRFEARFEPREVEVVVLTGASAGGASRGGRDRWWRPSMDVLGYVAADGSYVEVRGRLEWLATEDQRVGWGHHLEPATQYRVRVRPAPPPDPAWLAEHPWAPRETFYLLEVLARGLHVPELDARLERYRTPRVFRTELGEFTLDRRLGAARGRIDWLGGRVSVSLDVDEGSVEGAETVATALGSLLALVADMAAVDARWRAFIGEELAGLANEWLEESGEELTPDSVAARVRLSELPIGADGTPTPYYDDGDLFGGHVIIVDIDPDGTMTGADIAG